MRRLKGSSLLEAIVAALIFLIVFIASMDLMPHLAVSDKDALRVAEAEYQAGELFKKYGSGVWPTGEYDQQYEWGRIEVEIAAHKNFENVQSISIKSFIDGSRKRITLTQFVEWQ